MPWIQLGNLDTASTLTPPPQPFPENTTSQQRAAMRFGVSGNAVCMSTPKQPEKTELANSTLQQSQEVQVCSL